MGKGVLSPCQETRDPQGLGDLKLQSARKIRARVGGVACLRDQQLAGTGGRPQRRLIKMRRYRPLIWVEVVLLSLLALSCCSHLLREHVCICLFYFARLSSYVN